MDIFLGIIIGLFVLMVLIVGHEFGHFILARRNGVIVKEFGIGFPPRAKAWRRIDGKWVKYPKADWKNGNEVLKTVGNDKSSSKLKKDSGKFEKNNLKSTSNSEKSVKAKPEPLILSLNWLPIGGFCQMDGESDSDTRKGTFGSVSYWSKTKILFGGVLMNWLMAFLILTILAWTGMPIFLENQFTISSDEHTERIRHIEVVIVAENSPAEIAGFQVGDKILTQNNEEIYNVYDVASREKFQGGETVDFTIERYEIVPMDECEATPTGTLPNTYTNPAHCEKAVTKHLTATLNPADSDYLLGITMQGGGSVNKYTWSAPLVGAGTTLQLTKETIKGLGKMLWNLITGAARQVSLDSSVREQGREQIGEATSGVTGIVGMLGGIFPAFVGSASDIAFIAALISVSLACMNILPIPALDGGRWLLITIYKLRKKKLTKEKEEAIVAKAFVVLLGLMVIVTILDIIRLF